jgi:hypothetical protein
MSKTEIELRQAAMRLLGIYIEKDMNGVECHPQVLLDAKIRLVHAVQASQDAEQREQDNGGFAA